MAKATKTKAVPCKALPKDKSKAAPKDKSESSSKKKRSLKRKNSDTSDSCKSRPILLLKSQFAIQGRCLKTPLWLSVKHFMSDGKKPVLVPYTPITTRGSKWVHQMLSNTNHSSDYSGAIKLALAALSQGIDAARNLVNAKTVVKVVDTSEEVEPEKDPAAAKAAKAAKAAAAKVADTQPVQDQDQEDSSSEDESGAGSVMDLTDIGEQDGDSDEVAARKVKAVRKTRESTKLVSVVVFGQTIETTTCKAPLRIKFEQSCILNFIKAIKKASGMHEKPTVAVVIQPLAIKPPEAVLSSPLHHPAHAENVYYNWRHSCYAIRYWSKEQNKFVFTSKTLKVVDPDEDFEENKERVFYEAKMLWNDYDESDKARFVDDLQLSRPGSSRDE